jgi:hypothetical protein
MKNEYLHNFACWAAARAVQNPNLKGTNTKTIKNAIELLDLFSFVENPERLSDYPIIHDKLVVGLLNKLNWVDQENRYGVAAKIIAIYFKVAIIIPEKAQIAIIESIYPPIDAHNLKKLKTIKNSKWTKLNKEKFDEIIIALKKHTKDNQLSFINFEAENHLITNNQQK